MTFHQALRLNKLMEDIYENIIKSGALLECPNDISQEINKILSSSKKVTNILCSKEMKLVEK